MSRQTSNQPLANQMKKGFEQTAQAIEELAGMVKRGFDSFDQV
jgi:hypothetical protein